MAHRVTVSSRIERIRFRIIELSGCGVIGQGLDMQCDYL